MNKIDAARQEYMDWSKALGVDSLQTLNDVLLRGEGIGLINICEAYQERNFARLADQIFFKRNQTKIVMMSGPSSSGKTSSAKRIAQQCLVLGMTPKLIELDDYFVNRDDCPLDENGEKDYESLGSMNVKRLTEDLNALLAGEEVELPKFDFVSGKSVPSGNRLRLGKNDLLFMEGIHALNPALTPGIDTGNFFKIYISALSALPIGEKQHGSTTAKRLMRRIIRDNRTRGAGPEDTILRWDSVRRGEINNIFPYQDNADVVFNSSMLYDLPMLTYYVTPLLSEILESSPAYPVARKMLDFLENVVPLKPAELAVIPPTSIMREFIGGQKMR